MIRRAWSRLRPVLRRARLHSRARLVIAALAWEGGAARDNATAQWASASIALARAAAKIARAMTLKGAAAGVRRRWSSVALRAANARARVPCTGSRCPPATIGPTPRRRPAAAPRKAAKGRLDVMERVARRRTAGGRSNPPVPTRERDDPVSTRDRQRRRPCRGAADRAGAPPTVPGRRRPCRGLADRAAASPTVPRRYRDSPAR